MSRIRVPLTGLSSGQLELDEEAARYVGRVHRLREGDSFVVFDPEQAVEADAVVLSCRRGRVCCEIAHPTEAPRGSEVPVWLLLGICNGERFEWALRESTALGVTDIVPTICARSASAGTRADTKRMNRWRRILVQGARQSGRGDVPRLHDPAGVEVALVLPAEGVLKLCMWEHAQRLAAPSIWQGAEGLALFIGPEGGLASEEAQVARSLGYSTVSLGPLVLRTETAVIAALGAWRVSRM